MDDRDDDSPGSGWNRRDWLLGGAALAGLGLLDGAVLLPGAEAAGASAADRRERAYRVRLKAAEAIRRAPRPRLATNGDEAELPGFVATFSKSLPHDEKGEVDARAMRFLLKAIESGDHDDFERIPLGGQVKLANPQAAFAFQLTGPDPSLVEIAPPPRFASPELAAEMVELYWQALARDVPFRAYGDHPLLAEAAEELSRLPGYRGPKEGGRVTPAVLFRGTSAGDLVGPYVSQFLLRTIPLTPIRCEQRIRTAVAGIDYLTGWDEWRASQNGAIAGVNRFDSAPVYLRNGRDLGEYMHRDFTYQAPLTAGLILLKLGVPADGGNPYKHSRTQAPFTTFGAPYLLYLLALVTQVALTACWYQKWAVHRRLRPEELGGRVEAHRRGLARYPLDESLLGARALERLVERQGTGLLPGAYPEGCPTHPAYPAGHAVIAGACVTVLKAFFDEKAVVPDPVEAAVDGLSLVPWAGPPLTVGGELDKLAANIGMGRNFGGIHWRTDLAQGLVVGEQVATQVLAELKGTGNELFAGFSFRRSDGGRVTI